MFSCFECKSTEWLLISSCLFLLQFKEELTELVESGSKILGKWRREVEKKSMAFVLFGYSI